MICVIKRAAGHFGLTADWRLEGWCWLPDRPAARPDIDITVNGAVVHSCVASQLSETLRDSRIGDGRYGFSLSIPAQAAGDAVVEARERRSGLVLGRVTFGSGADPGRDAELTRLEGEIAGCFARLRAPDPRLDTVANAMEDFGAGMFARAPPGVPHPVGRRADADALPTSPIAPRLSLIALAAGWPDTLAALRHGRALLPDAEMLLITHAPATIAAAGRIGWVQVVSSISGVVEAMNEAALRARGHYICVVDAPREFVAVGIAARLRQGVPARLGSGAAAALEGEGVHWLPPNREDGIAAILSRRDLHAVGGFEAAEAGRVDWPGFAAKLIALGRPVEAARHRAAAARRMASGAGIGPAGIPLTADLV